MRKLSEILLAWYAKMYPDEDLTDTDLPDTLELFDRPYDLSLADDQRMIKVMKVLKEFVGEAPTEGDDDVYCPPIEIEHHQSANGVQFINDIEKLVGDIDHLKETIDSEKQEAVVTKEDSKLRGHDGLPWPATFDAMVWATEFVDTVKHNPAIATDQDTMLGWFANAIMRGYDQRTWYPPKKISLLERLQHLVHRVKNNLSRNKCICVEIPQ